MFEFNELKKQCRIDYFSGSGAGGQHRNKNMNCVRLHHEPSGTIVVATEHRSRYRNRKLAFERLQEKLDEMNSPKTERIPTKEPAAVKKKVKEEKKQKSRKKELRKKIDPGDYGG